MKGNIGPSDPGFGKFMPLSAVEDENNHRRRIYRNLRIIHQDLWLKRISLALSQESDDDEDASSNEKRFFLPDQGRTNFIPCNKFLPFE